MFGRLLLIERKEALSWGFDPVANADASFDHAPNLASYAGPQYGTFTAGTGLSAERGQQASQISVPGEADSIDSLLGLETDTHGAQTFHTQHDSISLFQVIKGLCTSSRAMAAVVNSLVYG